MKLQNAVVALAALAACGGDPGVCIEKARQLEPAGDYFGINCEHPAHRIALSGDVLVCKCPPLAAEALGPPPAYPHPIHAEMTP